MLGVFFWRLKNSLIYMAFSRSRTFFGMVQQKADVYQEAAWKWTRENANNVILLQNTYNGMAEQIYNQLKLHNKLT